MATFSAGWHSYSFKSMLRSKFGSKDGKVSRPPATSVPPNASFHEGIATKDVSINDDTGLTVRIYLPACCIQPGRINEFGWMMKRMGTSQDWLPGLLSPEKKITPPSTATSSPGGASSSTSASSGSGIQAISLDSATPDRTLDATTSSDSTNDQFWQGVNGTNSDTTDATESVSGPNLEKEAEAAAETTPQVQKREYTGYMPKRDCADNHRLPVIIQFHAGGFVTGSKDSPCNEVLCRRLARVCNAIVIAVGYRLAPEHTCPAAYDDGYEVLKWLSRQAILGEVEHDMDVSQQLQQSSKEQSRAEQGKADDLERTANRSSNSNAMVDGEDAPGGGRMMGDAGDELAQGMGGMGGLGLIQEMADPWIAVHADVSRCLVLGVSSGGNIADQVTRRACTPQGVNDLSPLELSGQILMYPLFGGSMRTPSESKSKDAYFFDVPTCELVFKLFLGPEDFSMDHPAVNPMLREQLPPGMPPTLMVVADHDILTDRIIAYSVFLRNFGVDVQVNSYKDVVHGFASYTSMVNTPQAEACVEDIAMWVAKHVRDKSAVPSELSY